VFAVLHLADFSLQAVLRTEQVQRDQPAALFATVGRKSLVVAATAAARAAGVETGVTAPQALARCPKLLIRPPSIAAEAEARAALLAVALTVSPSVEDTSAGVCTIDLKGSNLAESPPRIRQAVRELDRLGLTATAGIARTPLLALYAARVARPVLVVEDEKNFLHPLPIGLAGPSETLASILAGWGLRTLGDVFALPCDEFVRRFGADGLAFGGRPRAATRAHCTATPHRRTFRRPWNLKPRSRRSSRCSLSSAGSSTAWPWS
jgi:nucleotidyltransferase/DNA polymerase involved in DNA repair